MESSFRLPTESLAPARFRFGDLLGPAFHLIVEFQADGQGGVRCKLQGTLGARTVQDFKRVLRQLLESHPCTLAIDLGALRRMDPTGLAALAEVSHWGKQQSCRIVLLNLPERVKRTVMRASLHQILDLADG